MAAAFLEAAPLPRAAGLQASPAPGLLQPPAAAAPQGAAPAVGAGVAGAKTAPLVGTAAAAVCSAALAAAGKRGRRQLRKAAVPRPCAAGPGAQAVEAGAAAAREPQEGGPEAPEAQRKAGPGLQSLIQLRAVPFLPEPGYRRFVRNVPGDAGFDPLGLSGSTPDDFVWMLEAEVKHGRIAMLAGVGFVAAELLHERLADVLNLPDLMAEGGCTPTLLNGGLLEPVLLASLVPIFGVMAFADINIPRNTGLPGYYGFDPLNFGDIKFSDLARSMLRSDVEWVAEAEVKHGRIAMIAVTYMAFREFLLGEPIWPAL